jgi:hypothetical protein
MRMSLLVSALLLLSPPAFASNPFTYADFEAAVNHIDIDECPEGLAEGDVFCRVSMANDALHVWVFSTEGEMPFVSVHSFYDDEIEIDFGN